MSRASSDDTHTSHTQTEEAVDQTPSVSTLNAHQRMVVALKVIDRMGFVKNLDNKQYQSIPIDQMRNAVRRACIEAGLVHRLIDIQYTTESRGATTIVMGSATLRFESVDDPTDYIDQPTLGQSQDNGDKNLAKFMTNLLKNAYKALLCIGEQDDIDSYTNEDIEQEAERIEAIRERRAKRAEAVKSDPFFGKAVQDTPEIIALRKRIGEYFSKGGEPAKTVSRYKAEHGGFQTWSEDTLKACIEECQRVMQ